jgi:predicted nucleic acid-binding protein
MPIGVDTGFFFALTEQHPLAVAVWKKEKIITSVIVLFELQRKLHQGHFKHDISLINDIEMSVEIVDITPKIAKRGARISHGNNIPAMDALILASFLEVGCKEIYTRDDHLLQYQKRDIKIINLKNL